MAKARSVPAITANATPSRTASTAAAAAARASTILLRGVLIDLEQSTMMISAELDAAAGPSASAEVTVTMALTSCPPAGRYSFWKTSTVNLGAPLAACWEGGPVDASPGMNGDHRPGPEVNPV